MGDSQIIQKKQSRVKEAVPDALVYEIVDGKHIYYRGYRDVLNGTKTIEQIMGESTLQSWIKMRLGASFYPLTEKGYDILGGELGIQLSFKDHRAADLAIFKSENLVLDVHYANVPPEVAIEIDVAADLGKEKDINYINRKIADYLKFGVKKIIWIFTKDRKIVVADHTGSEQVFDWDADIHVLEDVSFNLQKMLERRRTS